MRPTISQLRGWNLDALGKAADTARDNARTLDASLDSCDRVFNDATGWFGKTHDAAKIKVDQELDHGREIRNVLNRISDDAEDAARTLKHAKEFTLQDVDAAVSEGFTVTDTGEVSHPDAKKAQAAADHQRRIQSGLDELARLDDMYGKKLREAANDLENMRDGHQDVILPSGEKVDPDALVDRVAKMSPDERAAFMATLSPETVDAMVIANPEVMGNKDGIPFETRIAANEINIRNALSDELQKQPPDQARVNQLQDMLKPMEDPLVTRPADAGPRDYSVDRKYVMFSTEGNGRMIEMIGDIKPGIKGVGVIVPGTNTNLNGSGSNHESALKLAKESGSPIFLYLGGDFPQGLDKAADPSYAASMAPKLVDFGHEVDRAVGQSAPGTPVTYVGHSYGGAIVGTAEQMGLRADRILHASSAGTGVLPGGYTDPNPNVQRYSMTAPGDPIALVQSLPRDMRLSDIPGVDQIPGIPHSVDGRIGNPLGGLPSATDPDKIPGVTRLDTGYYGEFGKHPNQVIVGPDGHGSYWDDPNSDAFHNIAAVIGGGEATAYVERGIETNYVDIKVGDDGNFRAEAWDQARAGAAPKVPDLPWDDQGTIDRRHHPWDNPRVTDHPEHGQRIQVK